MTHIDWWGSSEFAKKLNIDVDITKNVDNNAGWTLILFGVANLIIMIVFKIFISPQRVEGMLNKEK